MINSSQRSKLKSMAHDLNITLHIGKNGVSDTSLKQLEENLVAHELVKCRVLDNCSQECKELSQLFSSSTNSDVVQVIGKTFVLYRENKKDKKIRI